MAVHKNACYFSHSISKKSVIASFPEGSGTRTWLEKLRDDQWSIVSFIPESRLVCATVQNSGTQIHLALTLPEFTTKSR